MSTATNFANQFLIAMPNLADPNFFQSVTLVCDHNDDGALGIVINHLTDIALGDLLEQMSVQCALDEINQFPVFNGGPVQTERGFILHEPLGDWDSTLRISDELGLTTSSDILAQIAEDQGPERALIALGYAGWGPGQLEQEMADNAWLTVPVDLDILFELSPERRWRAAAEKLGIDLDLLSGSAGHA